MAEESVNEEFFFNDNEVSPQEMDQVLEENKAILEPFEGLNNDNEGGQVSYQRGDWFSGRIGDIMQGAVDLAKNAAGDVGAVPRGAGNGLQAIGEGGGRGIQAIGEGGGRGIQAAGEGLGGGVNSLGQGLGNGFEYTGMGAGFGLAAAGVGYGYGKIQDRRRGKT